MKHCPQCSTGYPDTLAACPTHGLPLNEIRDLKPGMVVHHSYRIVRKLGQGGMGAVYLAQHTLMDEPRALKFLSAELSQDAAFTARFLREVRTLRQIRHCNVVDCGDLESAEDGSLFFSMEFVDGPDLRGFLRDSSQYIDFHPELLNDCHPERSLSRSLRQTESKDPRLPFGALPVPLALDLTRQIAAGLAAAHARGMVHRDIKPENILLARDPSGWQPKIADFGIVATKEASTAFTRTGGTLLTVAYAAPEQWRGTPAAQLDGRTDLYALGGLLYEMLTGQTPFHAESYEGWAQAHQTTPPPPPSALRPDLANWQGLDALVQRLLAKDREDRPKDVAELLGLIEAVRYVAGVQRRLTVIEEAGKRSRTNLEDSNVQPPAPIFAELQLHSGGFPRWVWGVLVWGVLLFVVFVMWRLIAPQFSTNQSQDISSIERQADALFQQKQYSEALPLFDRACTAGNGEACKGLGWLYANGLGVAQDYFRAAELFSKSCDEGNAKGCNNIGISYANGKGVTKDYHRAAKFFSEACDRGEAMGCNNLGGMYANGNGVAKDKSRAVNLFSKSCDAGNAQGCGLLGVMYQNGLGVAKDAFRASALYSKACDAGEVSGCRLLGSMYVIGNGVELDYSRAVSLLSKACDGGDAEGCSNLGFLYFDGIGVQKDSEKARQLFIKGCSMGDKTGCDWVKKVQ